MRTLKFNVRAPALPPILNPNGAHDYHAAGFIWPPDEDVEIYVDDTTFVDPKGQPHHARPRVVGRPTFEALSNDPRLTVTPIEDAAP